MRPCRSRSAPAIGLMRSPGKMLANVTRPANAGEPKRSSVKSTRATPTIDCAMRATCMLTSTRARVGTRSSAR